MYGEEFEDYAKMEIIPIKSHSYNFDGWRTDCWATYQQTKTHTLRHELLYFTLQKIKKTHGKLWTDAENNWLKKERNISCVCYINFSDTFNISRINNDGVYKVIYI